MLRCRCIECRASLFSPPGDELVPVDSVPGPGQIRNSNAAMLAALVAQAGGEPWVLPSAPDQDRALDEALRQAVRADMLLISGGVSAGKFDLVEPALARLGARFHFTGVRIQPGKPLVFGEVERSAVADDGEGLGSNLPFFGLPGNPISSAATFLLFGTPNSGNPGRRFQAGPRFALARLGERRQGQARADAFCALFLRFQPRRRDRAPQVNTVRSQGSGDLASFARSNCFLVVPEGAGRLEAGVTVHILAYLRGLHARIRTRPTVPLR